ncbi:MAG: ATP synthase F1 subunit gamma, partial [Anaerolineae bacterium]
QVTRAMQMVAASKMMRAQEQTLATRPYAEKAWEVLLLLAGQAAAGETLHPLLAFRPVNTVGLLLITADRGLAGPFNHNIIRLAFEFMREEMRPVKLITVGRKGRDFMLHYGGDIVAEFTGIPDRLALTDITPIARTVIEDFLAGTYDQVIIAYTQFINTLVQKPVLRQLLPLRTGEARVEGEYIYEPDPQTILGQVLPRFTELQVYQAILESIASEHSARMVAMRNASENAEALVDDLTLSYNRARQEAITKEIMDIAGGAEALAKAQAMAR